MNSAPSPAPALDVNDLNFDTCERLRHLDWLLSQLGIDADDRVLDVGGYPCYMARAFPARKIVTADIYANGHLPYVQASGAALPFLDNSFAVTIACDVLEHVPPQFRAGFLSELARVSSHGVIVAGPYTTPGAARAEAAVRSLLPESSPAQTWLAEHAECGLPSMSETVQTFHSAGAKDVTALPVGSLTEWMLFFAGQAAGERHHELAGAMKDFIAQYNRLHTEREISWNVPAYRHAIVAALNEETKAALGQLCVKTSGNPKAAQRNGDPISRFDSRQVEQYVESLGVLLSNAFKQNAATSETSATATDTCNITDSLTAEYIQRLETMLSHRGMNLPQRTVHGLKQRLQAAWHAFTNR